MLDSLETSNNFLSYAGTGNIYNGNIHFGVYFMDHCYILHFLQHSKTHRTFYGEQIMLDSGNSSIALICNCCNKLSVHYVISH